MTRVLPIFASGALAILTTGCAGTGARTDLKPVFPATLRNADAVAARTAVPPAPELTTWWRGYGDPELTRLVEKALTANLDVAQAETRLREADALVRRARADRLPGGAVTGSVARQRQSLEGAPGRFLADIPGFSRDQTVFDTGAQASWELDLFGRPRSNFETRED